MKLFEVLKPLLEGKADYILKNQVEQLYAAVIKDHSFISKDLEKFMRSLDVFV